MKHHHPCLLAPVVVPLSGVSFPISVCSNLPPLDEVQWNDESSFQILQLGKILMLH
jgi:hypothetical protein